jgi:hypothetical protein
MRKRVWWVGLLKVIRKACRYIVANRAKLPPDLPAEVTAAFAAIIAACAALEAYDRSHPRGEGV